MSFSWEHPRHVLEESQCKSGNAICYLCKVSLESSTAIYSCRGCKSDFHKDCLTVTHPNCHEHTLTFIRRDMNHPCDVCALKDIDGDAMYGCLQCDFFLHRRCIYLPKVIKITRHPHRLYYTLHVSKDDSICRICQYVIQVGYGGYYCIDKTCNYYSHPRCILGYNVWDGKDLEGEPEEEEEADFRSLLVDIDDKSIRRHFSHDHDLLLSSLGEDSEHVCQACILPINNGTFLSCKQCDFALHDTCANLPRKLEHGLHRHPVTLHVETMYTGNGFFTCSVCKQYSCGFMYKCIDCDFKMDLKCASFVEPFNHPADPRPFYLALDYDGPAYWCTGCRQHIWSNFAGWIRYSGTVFDFKCMNLPGLMRDKIDDHPLILYYVHEYATPMEICEICEDGLDMNVFYICHHCSTARHVDCVLGKYPYLKYGHTIKVNGLEVEVTSNNGASRPICQTCGRICQYKQIFKGKDHQVYFCSIECIPSQNRS